MCFSPTILQAGESEMKIDSVSAEDSSWWRLSCSVFIAGAGKGHLVSLQPFRKGSDTIVSHYPKAPASSHHHCDYTITLYIRMSTWVCGGGRETPRFFVVDAVCGCLYISITVFWLLLFSVFICISMYVCMCVCHVVYMDIREWLMVIGSLLAGIELRSSGLKEKSYKVFTSVFRSFGYLGCFAFLVGILASTCHFLQVSWDFTINCAESTD